MKHRVVLIILIIKFFYLFLFITHLSDEKTKTFVTMPNSELGSDDEGYFSTIDNLLEKGEYFYNGVHSNSKMYAPRVPGVSLSYLLFRSFMVKKNAINCLIIFQELLFICAMIFLISTLKISPLKRIETMIFILIIGFDCYLSYYNNIPYLGESITTSIIIITIYYINRTVISIQKKNIFIIGLLSSITIFFKVANIAFYFSTFAFIFLLLCNHRIAAKKFFLLLMLFLSPLIFLETIWVTRNFLKTKKFIPLQEITGSTTIDIMKSNNDIHNTSINFCKSFGGDWIKWNPNSTIAWFSPEQYLRKMNFSRPEIDVFPKHIRIDENKIKKLKEARQLWWNSLDESINLDQREKCKNKCIKIFNSEKKEIYVDHPFLFHVGSRFISAFNLLYGSSTYYFPYTFSKGNFLEKSIKIMASLLFYIVMIIPIFFLPIYLLKYNQLKNHLINFCYLNSLSFLFLYGFLIRSSEFRFNHTIYLFFMIITFFFFCNVFEIRKLFKHYLS